MCHALHCLPYRAIVSWRCDTYFWPGHFGARAFRFLFSIIYGFIRYMNAQAKLTDIATRAGIVINGDRNWDIQVHDDSVYNRIMRSGQLALGESFMDKSWDCDDLATAFAKCLEINILDELYSASTMWLSLKARLFNLQNKDRAFQVGQDHYDYGNDMYRAMLGPTMVYTSADYRNADNLNDAQTAKLELICQKLQLQPGKRLLDIGCGWGSLMKYAAEHYGVKCVGVSVSEEQTKYARETFGDLDCRIDVVDYRDFQDEEGFDYITSIEMIEAVGPKNYSDYFKKIYDLLKPDGQVLIQAIGTAKKTGTADPWIDKYIFPNGTLPSLHELVDHTHGLLVFEQLEDIGRDYDRTLMDWWHNLESAYPQLHASNPDKYNERFLRMFKYYLQSCAALARTRTMYDWQIVFTKKSNTVNT